MPTTYSCEYIASIHDDAMGPWPVKNRNCICIFVIDLKFLIYSFSKVMRTDVILLRFLVCLIGLIFLFSFGRDPDSVNTYISS